MRSPCLRSGTIRLIAAAVCATALAAVSAPAMSLETRAGRLHAVVEPDPWHLRFTMDEATSLAEAPERTLAPAGSLGFRTAAGWMHATRVAQGRRRGKTVRVELETTDPDGRRLEVELRPDGEGVIALTMRVAGGPHADVEALGVGFVAEPAERFFGLGERPTGVGHRGRVVENYVADGPYQEEEREFVAVFVPTPGFRDRDDATYFPVPWLLSSRGVGVLVDNDEVSYFRLGSDDPERWSLEVTGTADGEPPLPAPESLRLRVFAGPTPADVLRRFTARIGRQPAPAAPWVLGPWVQLGGSLDDRLDQMTTLRAADAPVSVIQTYTHYLPCGSHTGRRETERALVQTLHDTGAAITTYFNPMVCESYESAFADGVAADAFTRDAAGDPYVYIYTGSTIFRVGQVDFSGKAGRRYYGSLLAEAVEDGHDGWMEDFGEYTPLDAYDADGVTGTAHHNRYVTDYHCGAWDFVRRQKRPVVRFQRSGWTGVAPCAQVVWNGDPSTDWGFDGLTSALWGGLGMGFSGIALWGSDVGGFFALGERTLTPELLMRWVQFGAVSGVMRTQHNGFSFPEKERPQIYEPEQIGNWKRWAKWRTQLYPYLATAAAEYRRTGLPIMRHLALVVPDDAEAVARDDQFLFGPDLLAAPVLAPGQRTREVYLPAGEWIDLWRSGSWDSAAGAFVLEAPTLLAGGRTVQVPAPLDELPLLVRAGAVLPLLAPDVDTLADYGVPAPGFVSLDDRRAVLHLLAFPRGETRLRLADKTRIRARERDDGWELALRGRGVREWVVQASLATLERPFAACAVRWRGKPMAGEDWSYDPETGALRVTLSGKRGRLQVAGGC